MKPSIVLATLNARYTHASLGLRYLRANLGNLREQSVLCEFTINQPIAKIVADITALNPRILGLGVYIWNVEQTKAVISALRQQSPELIIVLGGPEVSYETNEQAIVTLADFVITGWGDISFRLLCETIFNNQPINDKVITGIQAPLHELTLPYAEYSDHDLAHRTIYVEASRGCPFKCSFCLSARDKTAWAFPENKFIAALDMLHTRGLRQFKFVDRTFNLKIDTSLAILDFMLAKIQQSPHDPVFAHFELIPDRLPEALKTNITRFPSGTLQFEIGVQTLNPNVQRAINRRQDNLQTIANLNWLVAQTQAHLHVDLIIGLPDEDLLSIGHNFDQLIACHVHEIQVGLLKRLRGAPIVQDALRYDMKFEETPPYSLLSHRTLNDKDIRRLSHFARYWDLIGNSGRYAHTLPLILGDSPFTRFLSLSDALWHTLNKTHGLSPERLSSTIFDVMCAAKPEIHAAILNTLVLDYQHSSAQGKLVLGEHTISKRFIATHLPAHTPKRQQQHL